MQSMFRKIVQVCEFVLACAGFAGDRVMAEGVGFH